MHRSDEADRFTRPWFTVSTSPLHPPPSSSSVGRSKHFSFVHVPHFDFYRESRISMPWRNGLGRTQADTDSQIFRIGGTIYEFPRIVCRIAMFTSMDLCYAFSGITKHLWYSNYIVGSWLFRLGLNIYYVLYIRKMFVLVAKTNCKIITEILLGIQIQDISINTFSM